MLNDMITLKGAFEPLKKITILCAILLASCSSNRMSNSVELVIVNDNILSLNAAGTPNSSKNAISKKNIITYKIINNTNKNYLFVLDEDLLEYERANSFEEFSKKIEEKDTVYRPGVYYNITSSENKLPIYEDILSKNVNLLHDKIIAEEVEQNENYKKLHDLNYKIITTEANTNVIRKQSFVLHPAEYRIFQKVLYLPVENENNEFNTLVSRFKFDKSASYKFNLVYVNDSKIVKKTLPNEKLQELKDNSTEIYSGVLKSNSIPIKFID